MWIVKIALRLRYTFAIAALMIVILGVVTIFGTAVDIFPAINIPVVSIVMILVFLGSWRSTVIVAVSIPLSMLVSIIVMSRLGQTFNIMTLGGLSLAVGILVDDATVEIENIHRNLGQGKPIKRAILDGVQQIATPALVATLSICIVFVPVVFLSGVAKYLFVPLAMAVVFAMQVPICYLGL